jgi:RES domain-containing protein
VRIYRLAFGNDLSQAFTATGAYGRWNHRGSYALYLSEHPALAALEILNYWAQYLTFDNYYLFALELTDTMIEISNQDPRDLQLCREIGTNWLKENSKVALKVHSVAAPESHNYVLNPKHSAFMTMVPEPCGAFNYDQRILDLIRAAKH